MAHKNEKVSPFNVAFEMYKNEGIGGFYKGYHMDF